MYTNINKNKPGVKYIQIFNRSITPLIHVRYENENAHQTRKYIFEMATKTRLSGLLGSESITEVREKSHDNIGSHPQFQCCDRDRHL